MKRSNIFDEIINNEDVCDIALCAFYDFFQKLVTEFETSAFYRIKKGYEASDKELRNSDKHMINDAPPF